MQAYRILLLGALGGLGSGVLATLLELSIFPTGELGAGLILSLLGTIAPLFVLAGAALGLLLAGCLLFGRGLARLLRVAPERWAPPLATLAVALLCVPGMVLLLRAMAQGRRGAELLGATSTRVAAVAAAALVVWGATWAGLWAGRRLARSTWRLPPLAAGMLLVGAAQLLFHADASLYERLYLYLHYVLLAGYLLCGVLGSLALWRALFPAGPPPRPGRRRLGAILTAAALILAVAGGFLSRRTLASDQHLRYCALELAVVSSKLLLLLPLEVPSEAPLFLQSAVATGSQKGGLKVADANIVMVSIDALRPDHLGAYGYTRPTSPNIDALAARSVRFENAYCQVPLTCYSVPSLHTGDYLRSTLPILPKPPPTLARMLAARGYTTAAFFNSSMFFCDDERATSYGESRFGFEYAETPHREAEPLTDQVLAYLQEHQSRGRRKLFLWVHYFDVHEPYEEHGQFPFGSSSLDRYDSEIAYVDQSIGRLIAALAELPGPTIFVLTSDHGEEFKEHGGYYHGSSLYEEQIRVPLIIGVPGVKPRVVRAPAQLVDVVPTLLSVIGQTPPDSVHGRSLAPLLTGKDDPERAAYIEVHTKKAVRWRDWKLIDDYRRGTQELYDLASDPRERVNVASRRPAEVGRLKGLLQHWYDQIRAIAQTVERDTPEAIDLGRIGDRRALPLLAKLLLDASAAQRWRREAARLIGQLQDGTAAEALWRAVGDDDEQVAAEAAIALGEVKDLRARAVLPPVMETTEIDTRLRAGIALGRVDSPAATPALIQALWSSNWETQNRAAHYLGFVGDRRALAALLRASSMMHLRPRLGLALGRTGLRLKDKRVMQVLLDWVRDDPHLETRLRALAGLGFLGDRRAVRPLAKLLADEPDLLWVPETLTRIGGIGSYWVPGVEFNPSRRGLSKEGWGECVNNATILTDDFRESSWCTLAAPQASVQLNLQRRPFRAELQLRVRPLESWLKGQALRIAVNGRELPPVTLKGGWQTIRLITEARLWKQGRNQLRLGVATQGRAVPASGLVAVDYLLLVPREGR